MRKHLHRFFQHLIDFSVSMFKLKIKEGLIYSYSTKQDMPRKFLRGDSMPARGKQCLGPAPFSTSLLRQEDAQAQDPQMREPGLC